jgi:hypothetical protein
MGFSYAEGEIENGSRKKNSTFFIKKLYLYVSMNNSTKNKKS